jgi:hypothetical protein
LKNQTESDILVLPRRDIVQQRDGLFGVIPSVSGIFCVINELADTSTWRKAHAVIKNVFNSGHIMVTTVTRVAVKMVFASFGFNLFQLLTLRKQGI